VKLKTRLLAGAGTLALVGGIAAAAVPASAVNPPATAVASCTGEQALAAIKTAAGTGITNTLQTSKISVKSLATVAPTCNYSAGFGGGAVDGAAVVAGSLKSSISGQASCNTALIPAPPALPASGKIGWLAGIAKEQGYVRFAASDPTVNFYQDVVSLHGLMTKGALAGADIDGGVFQNPTVKDKTVGATFESFTGVDMNPVDGLIIGASCQAGASAGSLSFNNGLGGAKGPVAAPTAITSTMVGDGGSLLETTGALAGKIGACPCVTAPGLVFSAF
jgi:hypothetical protein